MHFIRRPRWVIPESKATPEWIYRDRRSFLAQSAATVAMASLGPGVFFGASGAQAKANDLAADLYPVRRNEAFTLERPLTPVALNHSYNNFYEFGSSKEDPAREADAIEVSPWPVKIDGLVEKEMTIDAEDLIRRMPLEERLYRHRCVEAWAMTVPWTGFAFRHLLDLARPLGSARYVRMETFLNPEIARGQRAPWYPWPYVEALTIEEAANDLALLVVGDYGKPLAKQMGAPLRLAVPWKYGFKSIKSIVRFSFVEERPLTFWEESGPKEYGFWASVNPEVPHPRWSQATERFLGSDERFATKIFNGYGAEVSELYSGMGNGEELYR